MIDPSMLDPARSIAVAQPGLFRFMADLPRYRKGARATMEKLAAGMQVRIGQRFPLAQAALAHRLLAEGSTSGSTRLLP